jgi:glycosyltransferase involved in cell wall biosynthesis
MADLRKKMCMNDASTGVNTLVSAFACDPTMGSEPYVGWNWAKLWAKCGGKVLILTRVQHRATLKKALEQHGLANVDILAFDFPFAAQLDHRSRFMKAYYIAWQFAALPLVLWKRFGGTQVDVIHHCTYNVVDFPGLLWMVPRVRFIWGPVGGGQSPPKWAKKIYGRRWFAQRFRRVLKACVRINPFVIGAALRAQTILVANDETMAVLPNLARRKSKMVLETAFEETEISVNPTLPGTAKKILWIGQLEGRKGLSLFLEAWETVAMSMPVLCNQYLIRIIGAGSQTDAVRNQIRLSEHLSSVQLVGKLAFKDIAVEYTDASALVFTSVQDTSGNVILEALAHGVPVIAFNHQGAKAIIQGGGGHLISADTYQQAVDGLSAALTKLVLGDLFDVNHSAAAIANIKTNHTWNIRARTVEEIYNEVFASTKNC